jgi:hypothetical protein
MQLELRIERARLSWIARRARRVLSFTVVAALTACRPEPSSSPNAGGETSPPASPTNDATAEATPTSCGPRGERFDALEWIPGDTKLAILISGSASDEALAKSHATLGEWVETGDAGVPIYAGLEYGQLAFSSDAVRSTLTAAGFHPEQLLRLVGPKGESLWSWRTTCDLDEIGRSVQSSWSMELRTAVEGRVGTSSDPAFPFQLLLLSGGRAVLVPLGQAERISLWLDTDPEDEGPGMYLSAAEPAPLVSFVQGHALLMGEGAARGNRLLVRASGEGVDLRPVEDEP